MRPRHADTLKAMGFEGEVDSFRSTLAAVKAELYPEMTDEELSYTGDEAVDFCKAARAWQNAPKLTHVFSLRPTRDRRKNGWKPKEELATV